MIRFWLAAAVVGVLGAVSAAGILTSTSGDLEPLVAWQAPAAIQIPGLIVVGLLMGLILGDLPRNALAYAIACLLAASLHVLLYAVPGFDTANYTAARFNNGLTTSIFVLMFAGIFLLAGQLIAFAINVYARQMQE